MVLLEPRWCTGSKWVVESLLGCGMVWAWMSPGCRLGRCTQTHPPLSVIPEPLRQPGSVPPCKTVKPDGTSLIIHVPHPMFDD